MISLKDNSVYIEKKTEQDASDNDWAKTGNTTVGYTSKELVVYDSTVDSVTVDNMEDKELVDSTNGLYNVNATFIKSDNTIIDGLNSVNVTNTGNEINTIEVNQLTASDAQDSALFGHSTSLSADGLIMMIGSIYYDTTAATGAGKVYTYKRATIDDAWTEVNQLTASDAQANDNFGVSVALSSDGLIAMVGAWSSDTIDTNAGKVYTYKRATIDDAWTEVNTLTASDAQASDYFGSAVALSSDGLIAMVGAQIEDTAATDAGKVYTYKRATIDDTWIEVNQLTASDAQASDYFGISVALSSDGLIAMVGAYSEDTIDTDTGKVYTYKRATIDDAWIEVNTLTASDAQASDAFGSGVSLSSDGLIAMVGAYTEDTAATDAGKVYTYKRATIDDAWTEVNQLTASDAQANDAFGRLISGNSDFTVIAIGAFGNDTAATDAGKVYTYKLNWLINKDIIDLTSLTLTNPISKVFEKSDIDVDISLNTNTDKTIVKEDIFLNINKDTTTTNLIVDNQVDSNIALNIDNTNIIPNIVEQVNYTNSNLAQVNPNIKVPMAIDTFTDTTNDIFNAAKGAGLVVTKARVYLIGTTGFNVVQSAAINADGTLGTWRNEDNVLPNPIDNATTAYSEDKVYVIGTNDSSGNLSNVIFSANISKDGIIGAWTEESNVLPVNLKGTASIIIDNTLFVIGGMDDTNTVVKTVYMSTLNNDGSLSTFTSSAFQLPTATYGGKLFTVNDKVYYVGGSDGTSTLTTIYSTTIGTNGGLGAWSTETATLPLALQGFQLVANGSTIILLGGYDGSNGTTNIVVGDINIDGTLDTFTLSTVVLTVAGWDKQAFVLNDTLYVLGGYGSTSSDTVYTVESTTITNGWDSRDIDTYYNNYRTNIDISSLSLSNVPKVVKYRAVQDLFKDGATSDSAVVYTHDNSTLLAGDTIVVDGIDTSIDTVSESNIAIPYVYDNKINPYKVSNGLDFTSWNDLLNGLPQTVTEADILITTTKAYIFGGIVNGVTVDSVMEADITAGVIGTFSVSTLTLPTALKGYTLIKDNNNAYIIGGVDGSDVLSDKVYTAVIDADGVVAGITTETNTLPNGVAYATGYISKSTIYLIGGDDTNTLNSDAIITNVLNSDNTLSTWDVSTLTLNQGVANGMLVVTPTRVYILGGGVDNNTVQYCVIDADNDLDVFIKDAFNLPTAIIDGSAINTNNILYVFGGNVDGTDSTVNNTIYTSIIDDNGILKPFVDTNYVVPISKSKQIVTVLNDVLYIMGGAGVNGDTSTTSSATLDGWVTNVNSSRANMVEYVITYSDIGFTPKNISVKDTGTTLTLVSKLYDGTMFTNTYDGIVKQGRFIQRKITISKKDTTLLTGLDTELYVV